MGNFFFFKKKRLERFYMGASSWSPSQRILSSATYAHNRASVVTKPFDLTWTLTSFTL